MPSLSSTGYYLCAAANLVICGVIALNRQRSINHWRLGLTSAVTLAWALSVPLNLPNSAVNYFLEVSRSSAWIAMLASIGVIRFSRATIAVTSLISGALLLAGIAMQLLNLSAADQVLPDHLFVRTGLLFALAGLIFIEQIYRNTEVSSQHALRYLLFAFGVPFSYDLYLYAQSELLGDIVNGGWLIRGFVCAGSTLFLLLFLRDRAAFKSDLAVSRSVAFYTTTMMSVGVYLSAMAVGGYYVRILGGAWGQLMQLLFLAGAALVLLRLMFSHDLRRRIRVQISKHFYRHKYDYRSAWLRFINTLSASDDRPYERSLEAVAQVIGSPGGFLFRRDDTGARFECRATFSEGVGRFEAPPSVLQADRMIQFLIDRQWIIDLHEYRDSPSQYADIDLPSWLAADRDARIVSPIFRGSELQGFLILLEPPPPFDLNYEDRDLLIILGRHIDAHLAQHETNQKLTESKQFETFSRLGVFMVHDLKNSAAQLNLVVSNAQKHKHNPEFINDAVRTAENVVNRIGRLIEHLRPSSAHPSPKVVRLDEIVIDAVQRCSDRLPTPVVASAAGVSVVAEHEALLGAIEHLIRNAQDATAPTGTVQLKIVQTDTHVTISVEDAGAGMDEQFLRDRLFKPFDSTKGASGMGIGAYQVRDYVRSIGGQVKVTSVPGEGTCFSIILPILRTMRDRVA